VGKCEVHYWTKELPNVPREQLTIKLIIMKKYEYKVREVPDTAQEAAIETKLNAADTNGFEFIGIFAVGNRQYAFFRREVNQIV
jgi:hypothetical protein